ncbi:MAG TPA: hypothetical protein DD438_03090, partial [Verrucomicrobiales bacterium]|nr:hypothetical protein [Verrucomicrobiales bacterium]
YLPGTTMVGGAIGAGACWCEEHEAKANPATATAAAIILVSFMVSISCLARFLRGAIRLPDYQ